MSIIEQMRDRPPYLRWELRQMEDRNASIAEGRYVARDVVFALLTPSGSKDVIPLIAEEFLKDCEEKARRGRYNPEWAKAFRASYDAWTKGVEMPESGTPIRGWPLLSPAAQEMYLRLNIRTVEDLALMTEEGIKNAGMGARGDKKKAEAWLEQAKTGADAGKVAALQTRNEELEAQVKELSATLTALGEQVRGMQTARRSQRRERDPDDMLSGAAA